MRPVWRTYGKIMCQGLPVSGDLVLVFFMVGFMFWALAPFGVAAQAGYGIGLQILQFLFLPAVSLAAAAVPIAAQNWGASQHPRVHQTFVASLGAISGAMLIMIVVCLSMAPVLVRWFNPDPAVIGHGVSFLHIAACFFLAAGASDAMGSQFQARGRTSPILIGSAVRIIAVILPVVLLRHHRVLTESLLWWCLTAGMYVQMLVVAFCLRRPLCRS